MSYLNHYRNYICCYKYYPTREMLMNALKVLVNNPFKESFYEKKKKQLMF